MAILIGAQYYRPPFPRGGYWADDLKRMKDSGLNTVQLWMVWGWIEAEAGRFDFSDYDALVEGAEREGLSVVLSTIAAVHPYWIHREVPDSEMITNMGLKVVSTNRREIHYGITPGGCIDHPGVRDRMERFLSACAERYASSSAVAGWDVWNELRWNVHSDGLVCYCDHTLDAFRTWLEARYGDLAGLNAAWERRYAAWDEVAPGKRPGRVYTEMMAFEEFICDRSVEHARWRYRIVKALNPAKPVTVHGGKPTVLYGSDSYHADESTTALHRGNDWGFAEVIDGVGTSSFPVWEHIDHTDFTSRIDFVRAAAEQNGKELWLSELQGGRSADGFNPQEAVSAAVQQRWIWTGLATGAKTILFWCWRDEIFGRESGGFGIIGSDGHAEARVSALKAMRIVLDRHAALFESYKPAASAVGVWFSPRTYFHSWCEDGDARRPMHAIQGVTRALLRRSVPYTIVEEDHLDALEGLRVLFMPRSIVVEPEAAAAIDRFLAAGGTLVTESEAGAFGANGLYRYQDERFLARYGVVEQGRRPLPADILPVAVDLAGERRTFFLPAAQWTTPFADGSLAQTTRVGAGTVIALGLYSAEAYYAGQRGGESRYTPATADYERFVADVVAAAGVTTEVVVVEARPDAPLIHVRVGNADGTPLMFVINEDPRRAVTLHLCGSWASSTRLHDLISDARFEVLPGAAKAAKAGAVVALAPSAWGIHVLAAVNA